MLFAILTGTKTERSRPNISSTSSSSSTSINNESRSYLRAKGSTTLLSTIGSASSLVCSLLSRRSL